jgi:hypothetical protein
MEGNFLVSDLRIFWKRLVPFIGKCCSVNGLSRCFRWSWGLGGITATGTCADDEKGAAQGSEYHIFHDAFS